MNNTINTPINNKYIKFFTIIIFCINILLLSSLLSSCENDNQHAKQDNINSNNRLGDKAGDRKLTDNSLKLIDNHQGNSIQDTVDGKNNLAHNKDVAKITNIVDQTKIKEKAKAKNDKITNICSLQKDDIIIGNKESKIIVVEYFSPTCHHCDYFHKYIFPKIKEKYIDTNKILYISREYIANKMDLDSSILARCHGDAKSYYKFIEILLDQQNNWAFRKNYREILANIGKVGGINEEKFATCLNDMRILSHIKKNTYFIHNKSEFLGTPSFFVNNKIAKDPSFESISRLIESEIKNMSIVIKH